MTTNKKLTIEISKLIELQQEGGYWDFKEKWYDEDKKSDLLIDIICMANNLENHDGYLIIGVTDPTENDGCEVVGVLGDQNRKNTQNIVDFLKNKSFAGGIRPTVYIKNIIIEKQMLDIVVIKNDRNTPYYLTKEYKGVHPNNIYTRIQNVNTPKDMSADIDKVERLWRKRFGLDTTALERALIYLSNPDDWVEFEDDYSSKNENLTEFDFLEKFYYKFAPEFTITKSKSNRWALDYVLFWNQSDRLYDPDKEPDYQNICVYYYQVKLCSQLAIYVDDHANYVTSFPNHANTFGWNGNEKTARYKYYFYVKGSIEYILHKYFYDRRHRNDDVFNLIHENYMKNILIFESEDERQNYEEFLKERQDDMGKINVNIEEWFFDKSEKLKHIQAVLQEEVISACRHKIMLDRFRTETYLGGIQK